MTVQEIVLDLLSYAGVYGFTLGGVPEDEAEIVRAVAGVNHAIQEIQQDGPKSLRYAERASFFNAPLALTGLTITQNQNTATMSGGAQPNWIRGCSIMIEGDNMLNRIMDVVYDAAAVPAPITTFTFLRAYNGSSGSRAATVYGDAVALDPDITAVVEPVVLAPNSRLWPVQHERYNWAWQEGPIRGYWYVPYWSSWEKCFGYPAWYRVEQKTDSGRVGGTLYLSINPIQLVAGNVTYAAYRTLPLIDRSMLAEEGGDDPNVEIECLPPDKIESLLLPIARWKYMAAHPALKNREGRTTVKTEYDEAVVRLKSGAAFNPAVHKVRARYL